MDGKEVRRIRLSLGWTQRELSERLGYRQVASISSWESDKERIPAHAAALLQAWEQGFQVRVVRQRRSTGPRYPKEPIKAAE
jgi:transcriptional regulator with XRE-family HTH domain